MHEETRKEAVKKLEHAKEEMIEVKHDFDEVVQKLIDLAEKFAVDPGKFLLDKTIHVHDGFLFTERLLDKASLALDHGAGFNYGLGPFVEQLAKKLELKGTLTTSDTSKEEKRCSRSENSRTSSVIGRAFML